MSDEMFVARMVKLDGTVIALVTHNPQNGVLTLPVSEDGRLWLSSHGECVLPPFRIEIGTFDARLGVSPAEAHEALEQLKRTGGKSHAEVFGEAQGVRNLIPDEPHVR